VPASAAKAFASSFDAAVRQRGEKYFRSGAVKNLQYDPHQEMLWAEVEGNRTYQVKAGFNRDGSWESYCDCPYADSYDAPCKHVWAILLAAEKAGLIPDFAASDPLPTSEVIEMLLNAANDSANSRQTASARKPPAVKKRPPAKKPPKPAWMQFLKAIRDQSQHGHTPVPPPGIPADRRIVYIIDADATRDARGIVLHLGTQRIGPNGQPQAVKNYVFNIDALHYHSDPADRQIIQLLQGTQNYGYGPLSQFTIPPRSFEIVLRTILQTGRCTIRADKTDKNPTFLTWDDGPPWEFWLAPTGEAKNGNAILAGHLRRDTQRMDLHEPMVVLDAGLLITRSTVARLDHRGAWALLFSLRQKNAIPVPPSQMAQFLRDLHQLPGVPRIEIPDYVSFTTHQLQPTAKLKIRKQAWGGRLFGDLRFDYDGNEIGASPLTAAINDPQRGQILLRDHNRERQALQRLTQAGFQQSWDRDSVALALPNRKFADIITPLLSDGWIVEAEEGIYRRAGEFNLSVTSGIDWFDLTASVQFGEARADLPELLKAIERGESFVRLDDGSLGMLPEEWLRKLRPFAELGDADGGSIRFKNTQAAFLDALLASMPQASVDAAFDRARQRLRAFDGIAEVEAPQGFTGALRPYQKIGVGWMQFLREFGFGGILADDMGLGKTIEVLAMLQQRKRDGAGPSLVVAPRSLIFNWLQEAARFTPEFRVLDQSGTERQRSTEHLRDYDLILTTYGTLRLDAGYFKDFTFDYAILDEAQAIKNAGTASAKAARLLRADHRLVLTGTPIENRLADLWSLFEFLNPGMLGRNNVFKALGGNDPDRDALNAISRAARPLILRRTKQQVASDLPERNEQTIFCELEPPQRKLYDELRDHYRAALLGKIAKVGIKRSQIQILEALLRLRQAACHPALIDPRHHKHPSAKLLTLQEHLAEIQAEGHKALVFSQFTTFLDILRKQLDAEGVPYQYLDGKTRNRQECVNRFQSDPNCGLFLISLKAGGVGLNLTAAEYVFLLDPWWNPAVEAQAIDRAHRIGQTRHVFAYRLIARDTVEEKVLQLQQSKRALADAILNADAGPLASLTREDLELLLT
jgi:hypothetical protein